MLRFTGECQPHTLREFVERYYPELLEAAESGCAVLTELQNTLAELLPLSQKLLPRDINQLTDIETQANLMAFIYNDSLFAFADKAYTILKEQCKALAEAICSHNDAEEDAADKLRNTLNALSRIPFDNLLDYGAVGLHRLDTFKDYLQKNLDFLVIPVIDANGSLRANWSFRDITGTIIRDGLSYGPLLTNCIDATLPEYSTIDNVVDDCEC